MKPKAHSEVSRFDLLEGSRHASTPNLKLLWRGGERGAEVFRSSQVFQSVTSFPRLPPGEYCNCFFGKESIPFPPHTLWRVSEVALVRRPHTNTDDLYRSTLYCFVYQRRKFCSHTVRQIDNPMVVSQAMLLSLPLWFIHWDSGRPEREQRSPPCLQQKLIALSLMTSSGHIFLSGLRRDGFALCLTCAHTVDVDLMYRHTHTRTHTCAVNVSRCKYCKEKTYTHCLVYLSLSHTTTG